MAVVSKARAGTASFVGWLILVVAVLWCWLQIPGLAWQYAYFLRIPLLMGTLLVALPAIARFLLPSVLKNLYVLRGVWQVAFTVLAAIVAACAVVSVGVVIADNAPARFSISPLPSFPILYCYITAVALAFPTVFAVVDLSKEEIDQLRWRGLFLGLTFSSIFLSLFEFTRGLISSQMASEKGLISMNSVNLFLAHAIAFLSRDPAAPGYIDPQTGGLNSGSLTLFSFFVVLFITYFIGLWLFRPRWRASIVRPQPAALFYLTLLIAIATLLLGTLTFFFDYWRLSVLFFGLVTVGFMYLYFQVDHFFHITSNKKTCSDQKAQAIPHGNGGSSTDFGDFVGRRLERQTVDEPLAKHTLVIVCASGGGIQAAGWTAQVLSGLQTMLGISFTKAMGLISSVSGGSVGTMYYLDRFSDQGYPPHDHLDQIFDSATADSLDSVGWGLAYPDLWRIISLPFLPPLFPEHLRDRGTTLETDWQGETKIRHLQEPLPTGGNRLKLAPYRFQS